MPGERGDTCWAIVGIAHSLGNIDQWEEFPHRPASVVQRKQVKQARVALHALAAARGLPCAFQANGRYNNEDGSGALDVAVGPPPRDATDLAWCGLSGARHVTDDHARPRTEIEINDLPGQQRASDPAAARRPGQATPSRTTRLAGSAP